MNIYKLASFIFLFVSAISLTQAQSITIKNNNKSGTYSESSFFSEFEIEYEGEFEIASDDRSVTKMSPGAYLKVSKSAFGSSRKVMLEADDNGKISRKYYTGWREREFEPEGKEWLREMLPEVVRNTAVGARSRISRFYSKGGIKTVMNEIPKLQGDFLQMTYLELVMEKDLSESELIQILHSASGQISSGFYLAKFLKENLKTFTSNEQMVGVFIEAGNSIASDFYQSDLLKEVIEDKNLDNATVARMLKGIGASVGSDHYLSQTLTTLFKARQLSTTEQIELFILSKNISSDHYLSQFLISSLKEDHFSAGAKSALLKALEGIGSDHYTTQVANQLSKKPLKPEELESLLSLLATQVSSDHYLTQSLIYLIRAQKFNSQSFGSLIRTLESVSSDHYATQVVHEIADKMSPPEEDLAALLQSLAAHVSSDHYLAQSLSDLAPLVKQSGPKAASAYKSATQTISSDTYLGKANRALR